MTIVYWKSGPCLVVELGAKQHDIYLGILQEWKQQGEMQVAICVFAALVV